MNYKYPDIESFSKAFYKRHPESKVQILEVTGDKIKVQDNYGICIYNVRILLVEGTTSIQNSIDKTKYWVSRALEKHGNYYNYKNSEYKNSKEPIKIICPVHGEFIIRPSKHLIGQGCCKCSIAKRSELNKSNTEKFINKANIIHNFRYDYSETIYEKALNKIKIKCLEHGLFEQKPNTHLSGGGCTKCKDKLTSKRNIENPTGWSNSNWIKAAEKSKRFDSFKVYIIECWNDNERFYKIGKTFTKINKRFDYKKLMPYNYKILKVIEGNSREISELETKLKNMNKKNSYLPKINFQGMFECFYKIQLEYEIISA